MVKKIFNYVKIYHNGDIIHKRVKTKLFHFGDEHNFMSDGRNKDIGAHIYFEICFKELWQKN